MSLLPDRPRQSLFSSRSLHTRIVNDSHSRFGPSSYYRPKPYSKPMSAPMRPAPDTRWNHDLFEDDSSLYGPKVRCLINSSDAISFGAPRPSPSLRPFGNSTATIPPAPASVPVKPTQKQAPTSALPPPPSNQLSQHPPIRKPQPAPISSNSGLSLLSRIQSKDTNQPLLNNGSSSTLSHLNNRPDPPPQKEIKIQQSQSSKNHQAFDEAMAKYLNGPVILEVANLADGTSAEDVKTAFADFGDIQECSTEEGLRQANQPTLKAKMIFTHKAEAEKAVEALNGALADGLTLAVKIIGRPTKKPERADYMTTLPVDTKATKLAVDAPIKSGDNDITMEDAQAPLLPTGRLRSEVVAQCDPRASIQVEPRPPAIYQVEHLKPTRPIIPNMLSRVQPLSRPQSQSPFTSAHHHSRQQAPIHSHNQNSHSLFSSGSRGRFPPSSHAASTTTQVSTTFHHLPNRPINQTPKSLLARIKPI